MALTSSNSYDSQTYALLALLALDIIGHLFGTMIALTTLCQRCGPVTFVPYTDARSGKTSNVHRQRRMWINFAFTQLFTCVCNLSSSIVLLFILLEYVGFRDIDGRNFRDSMTGGAMAIRLIAVTLAFWFRAYDRPPADMAAGDRLKCLNDNAWTMWLVGSVMTASLAWLAIHCLYVLFNASTCKDSSTGIMCSNTGTAVPYFVASVTTASIYSMFASVLTEYVEAIEAAAPAGGLSENTATLVRLRKCDSVFISFIGIGFATTLFMLGMMAFYPLEYDADSRFESASSGKTGAVLHLTVFVTLLASDYMYLLHILVPWRECMGGTGSQRPKVRSLFNPTDGFNDVQLVQQVAVTGSLAGLGA